MKRLHTLLGVVLALTFLSLSLVSCAGCEASGNNSGQAGRCGLFGKF